MQDNNKYDWNDVTYSAIINDNGVTTYRVKRGDSLWKIAKEFYGNGARWRRIYDANDDVLTDPQSLRVGHILVLPK